MRAQVEWYQREGSGLGEMKAFVQREGWSKRTEVKKSSPSSHVKSLFMCSSSIADWDFFGICLSPFKTAQLWPGHAGVGL